MTWIGLAVVAFVLVQHRRGQIANYNAFGYMVALVLGAITAAAGLLL